MDLPVAVVRVVRTCRACPSQWDAWTAQGVYVYVRYRSGRLTVDVGDSQVFCAVLGGPLDGHMEWPEVLQHAPIIDATV